MGSAAWKHFRCCTLYLWVCLWVYPWAVQATSPCEGSQSKRLSPSDGHERLRYALKGLQTPWQTPYLKLAQNDPFEILPAVSLGSVRCPYGINTNQPFKTQMRKAARLILHCRVADLEHTERP